MKTTDYSPKRQLLALLAAGLAIGGMAVTTRADMYRMGLNTGGGIPAQAALNPLVYTSTNCTLSWYGLRGYYSVEAATNLLGPWSSVASVRATDYAWTTTVANPDATNSYLFRLNQANSFAGSGACGGCHGDKYSGYAGTAHASATSAILNPDGSFLPYRNASCLPCHTVGYGQPTGFTNLTLTPQLANVGCENCHGAAGWHKNSDHSLIRPAVSIAPEICGSCHQGHNPIYEDYMTTLHAQVNDDEKYGFNSGVYYTNTITLGGTNLYGYYVTTNSNGTLKTNATSGMVSSLYGPQTLPNLQYATLYDLGQDRMASCGVCHSGATRLAMLNDYKARQSGVVNPLTMPSEKDAGSWGPTCAICHDPHGDYNKAQLRNPMLSTNYYTMATVTDKRYVYTTNFMGAVTTNVVFYGTTFASLYDPNVNVCGQCHNSRGARWDGLGYGLITNTVVGGATTNIVYVNTYSTNTSTQVFTNSSGVPYLTNTYTYSYVSGRYATNQVVTPTNVVISVGVTTNVNGYSRPPHHSPQYNLLTGILQPDYLNTNSLGVATNFVASHSGIRSSHGYLNTNQCATCHMPSYTGPSGVVSGHTFELNTQGCYLGGCHQSGVPDIEGRQLAVTNNIARITALLQAWATNYGPTLFTTNYSKYQKNAWEFTTVGELADPATTKGPSATEQLLIPAAIRQARFNLYMVLHDGSLGVHNPGYTDYLLNDADTKVVGLLPVAQFQSSNVNQYTNAPVTFNNLNAAALTSCAWDFGDGGTSTSTAASVSHTYATAGAYTVTLTATDTNGVTKSLTRPNYITVINKAVPSFDISATSGTSPLTVSFANTSQNADYSRWTFEYGYPDSNGVTNGLHGISANVQDPAPFTYTNTTASPITYTVKLTVFDLIMSYPGYTYSTNIVVNPAP